MKKLTEINILRAFACLSVMLLHISATPVSLLPPGSIHLYIVTTLNRSLVFCMPVFIFISGLLTFYKYQDREFNFFKFIPKRLKTVLLPYLFWTLVYYALYIVAGMYTFSFEYLLKSILLADMCYHLYFIALIVQFYLLFGIFRYLFKNKYSHFILGVILLINILFLKYQINWQMNFAWLKYADRFFLQYIFFFSLGCYAGKYLSYFVEYIKRRKIIIFLSYALVVILYTINYYKAVILHQATDAFTMSLFWFFTSFLGIMLFYSVALNIKNNTLVNLLEKISKSSYYIYLAHPFVLMFSHKGLDLLGITSTTGRFLINIVVVFTVTILGSLLYTHLKDLLRVKPPYNQTGTAIKSN